MTGKVHRELSELELPDGRVVLCANPGEVAFLWGEVAGDSPYAAALDGRAGDELVVDVGAHVGLVCMLVAARLPAARVLAFEPAPETFACLERNLAAHVPGAKAFRLALGASPGVREFSYFPYSPSTSTLHVDEADDTRNTEAFLANSGVDEQFKKAFRERPVRTERSRVEVTTLSAVFDEHDVDAVGLLKVDVERAELDVLDGVRAEFWPRIARVVLEVHDIDGRLGLVAGRLATLGYRVEVSQAPFFAGASVYSVVARRRAAGPGVAL